MNQLLEKLPLVLYLGINNLFLYKYGLRQDFINVFFLIVGFNFFILCTYFILENTNIKDSFYKVSFYFIVISFFSLTIVLNYKIDGETLNVDRWSAMNNSINALLENRYPYTELDHLNQNSSNLPSLLIIGFPFNLIGNIGLLQSFCFLLFSYVIYKTTETYKAKLFGILFLIFSVSYFWELYVKSDLMSNFILILSFLALYKSGKKLFKYPILLGFLSSFLFYTRIVSIIPLSIFLFKGFVNTTRSKKVIYIFSSISTLILLTIIIFRNYPSFEIVKEYNPFSLQKKSSRLPIIISLITLLIPFIYSMKAKTKRDIIRFSTIFLTIPILISFLIMILDLGFSNIISQSFFDISYFNIISPFLIYYMIIKFDEKQLNINSSL